MNSEIEIKGIIQSGEGYNAEFKLSVPSKVKEISEEVCAFIELFYDRIEISNPGGLVSAISKEEFGKKTFREIH